MRPHYFEAQTTLGFVQQSREVTQAVAARAFVEAADAAFFSRVRDRAELLDVLHRLAGEAGPGGGR